MNKFTRVSILLPVINETVSLNQTISIIIDNCERSDLAEFLILVSDRTTDKSMKICRSLEKSSAVPVRLYKQKLPYLGGAMRDGFELATGSHVLMMASDLETDPRLVKEFIRLGKSNPSSVVTATRWTAGGEFRGYGKAKLVLNYLFQKFFSLLYNTHLTDMTYGFRLFPVSLVKSIKWTELRHSFLFETILRPIQLGVKIIEIPAVWNARSEGESLNTLFNHLAYFRIGLKIRLSGLFSSSEQKN